MPHVLWQLQGMQVLNKRSPARTGHPAAVARRVRQVVADLVGFMVWLAEPDAGFRKRLGFGVLAFLVVLFGFAYAMKKITGKTSSN
jgi:ubiquinol-cytochrome c reductase cytochrome c1 subunit